MELDSSEEYFDVMCEAMHAFALALMLDHPLRKVQHAIAYASALAALRLALVQSQQNFHATVAAASMCLTLSEASVPCIVRPDHHIQDKEE